MFVDATAFSRNFFCDDGPLADRCSLTSTDFQGSSVTADMTCYDAMYPNGPFVMRNVNIRAVIKKLYSDSWDGATASTLLSAFGAIENWDVSRVTNMKKLFIEVANSYYASFTFNANLSKWNVSRVVTMQDMLGGEETGGLSAFNSQLSSWDISNVKSMRNGKIICLGFFF